MNITRMPEILAPVGSKEMLIAAVRSGADAVYLGAKEFNARRNADNFGELDLKEAIEYCHIRGVKVFLTLNIILSDNELAGAFELAKKAYLFGVDAVIVADIGLISLLNKHLPNLALHASTQMTVHTASAIPFIKKLGIKRVVLARELSKETIKEICVAAHKEDVEIEVFVHGAHCMSVSGQCLLSSMLGGRSGNRGLCAGPCRLPFAADGGNGYDLSLKDLSLSSHLEELTQIGVDSFKIEGRMKRPEYVAAATAALRNTLYKTDSDVDLHLMLNSIFSRSGFTDGYFLGKLGKDMFGIRTKDDVLSAKDVLSSIHSLYRNERQSIKISGEIEILDSSPIRLTLTDGQNTATAVGPIPEKAINRSIDNESVTKSLSKLGGTPFLLQNLECKIGEQLSVSASTINALRRECIENLCVLRATSDKKDVQSFINVVNGKINNATPSVFCRFDNVTQIPDNCDFITAFSLPYDCDVSSVTLPQNAEKWVELPRWIKNDEINELLVRFKEFGFCGAICSNVAQFDIAKSLGFKIAANYSLNIYNSATAAYLEDIGCARLTLSPELQLSGAKKINTSAQKGIIAYGKLPLMLMVNCPIKNGMNCKECGRNQYLTDRKGIKFPVRCRDGYSELLNSRPIYLADRMDELNGFDFITLYFTDETAQDVRDTITAYQNKSAPKSEYTRGLYYRMVE